VIKSKNSSKKSYAGLKLSVICMTHLYSNRFHFLLKKAETSYDNTSYKNCRLRSQNCKNAASFEV